MKTVIMKFLIYGAVGMPVAIFAGALSNVPYVSSVIWNLYLLYILIDIGWVIKNVSARKKYIIYMTIIIGTMISLSVLGNIFGFRTYVTSETENTIWDALGTTIAFAVIIGVLIKVTIDNKAKYPAVKWLYVPIFAWSIGALIM